MGAVMGSKNLKAIAVRGNKMPETVNPDAVKMFGKWFRDNLNDLAGWAAQMGTPGSVLMHNEMGMLPTRNFQSGTFKGAKAISGEKMHETILVGRDSCYACPVRCKLVVETKAPYNVNKVYGGPEYETLAALGSLCGVDDLAAVAKANELCNAYSLDTITTGNTIAFAMECYEKGLLSEKDCHGLQLNFGNAKAMLKLIDLIAYRKGIGDALANGIEKTAEMLGPEAKEAVLTVKGQPLPMHEPRLKQGLGLGYAISPTGADHCHNMYDEDYAPGGWGMADIEPLGIVEAQNMAEITPQKVRILVYRHFWTSLANCLVVCLFTPYPYEKQAEMVNAVTGWNTSVWELAKVGERSINMARMYSLREGLTEADDQLPSRIFKLAVGPEDDEHNTVDYKQFEEGKRLYYEMMGWDPVTGRPNTAKLYELGLDWLVHDPS